MPPAKNNARDVLRRHESKIRKLYATKNVESVKRIMEKEAGVPELAVSTWVEKIGDLGIRKNVTSDEWRVINLHCLCWLEDHTRKKGDLKLKKTKQPIEIVVRGRKYNWDQAWKNMKSAGAIGQLPQPGEPYEPLPPDIEIRAVPSVSPPVVSNSVERVPQPGLGAIDRETDGSVLCIRNQASQQVTSLSNDDSLSLTPVPFRHHGRRSNEWTRDYLSKTIGISWTGLLPICTLVTKTIEIQNLALISGRGALQRPRQESMTGFAADSLSVTFGGAEPSYFSEPQHKLRNQFLSALLWPPTTDLATSTSHKNYAKFFTVVYLLSNNFVELSRLLHFNRDSQNDLLRELDLVFGAVPAQYLEDLIHTRLVSIRAAYEALLHVAGYFKQQSAFQLLLKLGFRFDWIAVAKWGHQLLLYAVSMDLGNDLSLLLYKGCRPDFGTVVYHPGNQRYPTAICEALSRGNIGCFHRLLDRCDVNAGIFPHSYRDEWLSNFDCFLVDFDGDDEHLEHGLTEFIRVGADVNKPVAPPPPLRDTWPLGMWNDDRQGKKIPWLEGETRLSVLDYLFYFHRQIYNAVSSELIRNQPGLLSRACILLSLEKGGIPNLQQYLDSLAKRVPQQGISKFLKVLIAEQFLGCDLAGRKVATNLKTVRALASCNVSIAEVLHCFPGILSQFMKLIGEHPNEADMDAILQYLLENGAHVGGSALSRLIRLPDRRLFDLALDHVGSLRELHIAIADAASRNDLQAVKILLRAGVDLGVDTDGYDAFGNPLPMSIIARCIKASKWKSVELPVMLETLVKEGAVLRLSKRRPQLHHLLRFALDHYSKHATIQYILRAGYKDNLFLPSSLLDAWESQYNGASTFEHLFRHGARLEPGSPLAHWIERVGGIGLVREMLAAGASPNAYSRGHPRQTPLQAAALMLKTGIVELLLEAGADVNAAAKGPGGVTALQAACMNLPEINKSDEKKLKIIRLLLARGADVNAAPARTYGHTALQATAATGDLAAAKLLLLHAPRADVNAPPCQSIGFSTGIALDLAATYGRLDMVSLLLSYNALSQRRGESGYDGAISLAEDRGHLAVAELIREHAKHDQSLHFKNPYLSKPPRHWSEYGYKLDSDQESEWSYETDSAEYDSTDDESDNSTGKETGIPYDADERERPEALQEAHDVMVCPEVNQPSDGVYNHDVQNSTQPFTNDTLPTASTLDINSWAGQSDLGVEFEGHNVATHPVYMYASQQLDYVGASMDLDMSLGSGIGQNFGVQYPDRLDYDLNAPERLIYEVDGDFE